MWSGFGHITWHCSWIMGFTVCYLRLCSLGTHTCPFPGAVVTLVLPVDLAVVLCRLSCPDTKISVWYMASFPQSLATH